MARKARKARRPAARRTAKKRTKRPVRTAKLKGRKVAKPRARRPKKQGVIASAMQVVSEAVELRSRLGGRNTFEDE